jgi:hypothetical protein
MHKLFAHPSRVTGLYEPRVCASRAQYCECHFEMIGSARRLFLVGSGTPLWPNNGAVLALHTYGAYKYQNNQRPVALTAVYRMCIHRRSIVPCTTQRQHHSAIRNVSSSSHGYRSRKRKTSDWTIKHELDLFLCHRAGVSWLNSALVFHFSF